MPKLSKCKILVGKILTIQHALVKFIRLFHHQSFTLYGIIYKFIKWVLYVAIASYSLLSN